MMPREMRLDPHRLKNAYHRFSEYHQASDEEANIFAQCLLRADERGHTTQGIGLLPYLHELFEAKTMAFGRPLVIIREHVSTALVNGQQGVGQVIGTRAMDLAIDKARHSGVGFVSVRKSSDYGMAANYAIRAMEHGMIGITMSTGPLLVAPWGGRDALFCTNPISIAAPAHKRNSIVIDMATSANSMGKVVLAARDNQKLHGQEVVDGEGIYTDNPLRVIQNVMDRESPMSGALLPAGPKGFGMLLMVDLLSNLLSGERTWEDEDVTANTSRPAYYSQTYIAISIDHFQDYTQFTQSMDRMIDVLTSARTAEGFERIRLHGDDAAEKMRESQTKGVLIRDEEWAMVNHLFKRLGLSLP